MSLVKKYLILILSICLFSCEKVIVVDLETASPRLVVDASIDWVKNTSGNEQKIKLSTTTGYYNSEFPVVSGAIVEVINSKNVKFDFLEIAEKGEYVCSNFQPVIGETYTLKITVNGQTYTATETLTEVADIEENIEQNNTGGMGGDEVEIVYYYQDSPSQLNNYLYSVVTPQVAFPQYSAESDENNQGSLTPVYYSHKDLKPGDVVHLKLYGISKRYYDYFRKLLAASGADTGPFPTIPSAVRGNITNQTKSDDFPYGYFRLSEVSVKDYVIK